MIPDIWARFDSYVDATSPSGCHIWTGARFHHRGGYGALNVAGRIRKAHVLSWERANGPVPVGMFVCHRCDNPPCVNPAHLFLGSPRDNVQDMISKGRARPALGEQVNTAKLTEGDVRAIRQRLARGEPRLAVARAFRVSKGAIQAIAERRSWAWLE